MSDLSLTADAGIARHELQDAISRVSAGLPPAVDMDDRNAQIRSAFAAMARYGMSFVKAFDEYVREALAAEVAAALPTPVPQRYLHFTLNNGIVGAIPSGRFMS